MLKKVSKNTWASLQLFRSRSVIFPAGHETVQAISPRRTRASRRLTRLGQRFLPN